MFIIKCKNCGRKQHWGDGVTVGQGTVIEVADRAVYCECGAAVEEEHHMLNEVHFSCEDLPVKMHTNLC